MNQTEIVNSIDPTRGSSRYRRNGGALRRLFDIWGDPEKRDTSGWNVYYYYYRQVAQHTAGISLRRMKWIAILFQGYFFVHMVTPLLLALYRRSRLPAPVQAAATLGSFTPPLLLLLVMFLVPTIMVCNAFKLNQRNRGLMTSRAKDPPLLAHLSQYTTRSGMVTGALQSLVYTWCRFTAYLLPAILTVAALWGYAYFMQGENTGTEAWLDIRVYRLFHFVIGEATWFVPSLLVLLVTVSVFFTMQFFCYRLDTLVLMIFLVGLGVVILLEQAGTFVFSSRFAAEMAPAVLFHTKMFIPACIFGIVYFPLAASDTMRYGLGKQAKWLRGLQLLMVATGVCVSLKIGMLLGNLHHSAADLIRETAFIWTGLGVLGLLADSLALATMRAKNACMVHASRQSFSARFFDVSSPYSLIPIMVLEWFVVLTAALLLCCYEQDYGPFAKDFAFNPGSMPFRYLWRDLTSPDGNNAFLRDLIGVELTVWGIVHLTLGYLILRRRNNPQIKDPWNFYVWFNGIVMCSTAVTFILFIQLLEKPVWIVLFYFVSIAVMFILSWDRTGFPRKKKDAATP